MESKYLRRAFWACVILGSLFAVSAAAGWTFPGPPEIERWVPGATLAYSIGAAFFYGMAVMSLLLIATNKIARS